MLITPTARPKPAPPGPAPQLPQADYPENDRDENQQAAALGRAVADARARPARSRPGSPLWTPSTGRRRASGSTDGTTPIRSVRRAKRVSPVASSGRCQARRVASATANSAPTSSIAPKTCRKSGKFTSSGSLQRACSRSGFPDHEQQDDEEADAVDRLIADAGLPSADRLAGEGLTGWPPAQPEIAQITIDARIQPSQSS